MKMEKGQFPIVDSCNSTFEQEVACMPWLGSPRGPLVGLLKRNGLTEIKNDRENKSATETTAKKIEAMLEKVLQNQARQEQEINRKLEILEEMLNEEVKKLVNLENTLQEERNQWKGDTRKLTMELTRLIQQKEMQVLQPTSQTLPPLLDQKGKQKATKKNKKSSKVKQKQKEIQLTAQTLSQKGKEKATKKSKKSSTVKPEQKVKTPTKITTKLPSPQDKQPAKKKTSEGSKVFKAAVCQPDISNVRLVSQIGPEHCPLFRVAVDIKGITFIGAGRSKKLAKAAALKSITEQIPKENQDGQQKNSKSKKKNKNKKKQKNTIIDHQELCTLTTPHTFEDKIARLILITYSKLMQNQPQENIHIMLAGIVMTTGPNIDDAKVVCVATGTKCISGGNVSMHGDVVNDCHAEVISRRCLVDFLYSQLEVYSKRTTNADSSIFVMTSTENGELQFTLKDNIKFHLYIKSAPCGDARIFCNDPEQPHSRNQGQLRTKNELGCSMLTKSTEIIQNWDAIKAGQNLLQTMSCSDKIAKWNVLGAQGALLNKFITPVYFDSIILDDLYDSVHMHRAVVGRICEHLQDLPPQFKLNKPHLSCTSTNEHKHNGNGQKFSRNWTVGRKEFEIIKPAYGKTEASLVSRLAKQGFFARYLKLCDTLKSGQNVSTTELKQYNDFKQANVGYNLAKDQFKRAFQKANLGNWVSMPPEQGQFQVLKSIPS